MCNIGDMIKLNNWSSSNKTSVGSRIKNSKNLLKVYRKKELTRKSIPKKNGW